MKQLGQEECTRHGLRQRFRMLARGHRPLQSPSTVTTLIPRKGSLTSEVMWFHLATHLQIYAIISAWQHLQWGDSTGCGATSDFVYHPSSTSPARMSYLSCCMAQTPGRYSRRMGGNFRPFTWDANANCSGYAGATSSLMSHSRTTQLSPTSETSSPESATPSLAISGDSQQTFQPTWPLNLASPYVPESNPAPTGPTLWTVHEAPRSSNLKRTAASRWVNSGRRPETARTRWLYDLASVRENDDDDETHGPNEAIFFVLTLGLLLSRDLAINFL